MTTDSSPQRAFYRDEVVVFPSRAVFDADVERMLTQGLLWVAGDEFPVPLEVFDFSLEAPGATRVAMKGQIISRRHQEALIELHEGADALFRVLRDSRIAGPRREHRRFPRDARKLPVRLGSESCTTVDISPGGVCLQTEQPLPVGSTATGFIRIHDADIPFQGEVRWLKLGDAVRGRKCLLGIRILSVGSAYFDLFRAPAATSTSAQPKTAVAPPKSPQAAAVARPKPLPQHEATPASPPQQQEATPASPPRQETTPASAPRHEATPAPQPPVASTAGEARRARERRNATRVRKRLKFRMGIVAGFTFDISARGIGIETTKVLQPGSNVHGVLFLDEKELSFHGEVRWARAGNSMLGVRPRMGILLSGVQNEFFDLLAERMSRKG